MDAQSREKFWNTLYALDGVDVKQDAQKLSDIIQYPKYLYRLVLWMGCKAINSFSQVQIIMMTRSIRFYTLTFQKLKMK